MQQPSQYTIYQGGRSDVRREPPPYPGYNRGFHQAAGYRQSYASSETGSTDMSLSSCENLSTSMRQDPQGEETHHPGTLSSPIDMAHPAYHQHPTYIQGSPTAVEVKSANSSTFYVTGSVPNQIEEMNLSSYNTAPHMTYNNVGHTVNDVGGQNIMVPPMTVSSCEQHPFMQPQQQQQQQPQGYNTNQYYSNQGNSGQNQNTQIYMNRQNSTNQPTQLHEQQQQQPHYSNIQPVNSQTTPTQHYNSGQSNTGTTPSPQNGSKQDPFKKWRHFYVNQNTQLQQYRFLQQGNEQCGNQGISNNQKFEGQDDGQFFEGQGHGEVQEHLSPQAYVSESSNVSDSNTGSSVNSRSPAIGSGSMIARLKQEFCKPQTQPNNQNTSGIQGKERERDNGVSNVRAMNERIRSATPDFLSDRPLVSKQLPLRPSSANSKQKSQDRQQLTFLQMKAQKLAKHKSESATTNNDVKTDINCSEVDKNANKILSKLGPGVTHGIQRENVQTINALSPGVVQATREQLEHQAKLKSVPTSNRSIRMSHQSTLSSQPTNDTVNSTVLSHHPPPSYPCGSESDTSTTKEFDPARKELHRSSEMLDRIPRQCDSRSDLSSSQPDLSHLGLSVSNSSSIHHQGCVIPSQLKHDKTFHENSSDSQDSSRSKSNELDHAAIATRATQMVERLSEENRSLRHELEGYYSKVCRLQKFEVEIQKVTDAYEALVKHCSKRENLDKVMRLRLETEIKRSRENNRALKDQLEKALSKMDASGVYAMAGDAETKRELKEKDALITKLICQNREFYKLRDKLEVEVASQKERCENYTNHIEILEATLKSCQKDKLKLEEQISNNQQNTDKVEKLQHALTQLQAAAEKRESIEQKLRNKLEDEVRSLKTQKFGKASDTDEGISSDYESPSKWHWMTQQMQEKDQELLKLQAQVAHYEQKFIEETAMRQLAVDVASMPKDAKIAALEQNSHETERLINEARSERLKHLEELYKSSKKAAEFEARVKTLTASLAEKEAIIKVLQKQSFSLSRTSSVSSLFTSPLHSPHQSMVTPTSPPQGGVTHTNRPSSGLASPISPVLSHREMAKLAVHSKSNSDGVVLDLGTTTAATTASTNQSTSLSLKSSSPSTTTVTASMTSNNRSSLKTSKSLRQLLAEQAKLFQSWQSEQPDDVTKECWQV